MKALSIPLLLVIFWASLPAGFCDTDPQDGMNLVSETFSSYFLVLE